MNFWFKKNKKVASSILPQKKPRDFLLLLQKKDKIKRKNREREERGRRREREKKGLRVKETE